ncbi:5-formyltetrahydrofolate cyclo-ligase, partial [Dietzia sp. E1]|nr:5-formyltetrahydrofolate cyclo-ligase [Dietzia sp. E1]
MSQDEPDVGAGPTADAAVKARLRREVLARRAAVPAPVRVRRDR